MKLHVIFTLFAISLVVAACSSNKTKGPWPAEYVLAGPENPLRGPEDLVLPRLLHEAEPESPASMIKDAGDWSRGRVDLQGARLLQLCLSTEGHLRCQDSDLKALIQADGHFVFEVPALDTSEQALIVAELSSGQNETFVLAAPVDWNGSLNVLSTLVAAQARALEQPSTAQAYAALKSRLKLSAEAPLLAVWDDNETMARAGWQFVFKMEPNAFASSDFEILTDSLGRYLRPDTGRFWQTVSAKSLISDLSASMHDQFCPVFAVEQVSIDTEDEALILPKPDYIRAHIRISGALDGGEELLAETRIRGRGNTTWEMPKKPYRLKLDEKQALFGMQAEKNWALLANYVDKTLLRNDTVFCMGQLLGMPYTPQFRHVDLSLNGEAQGLYQLSQYVRSSKGRVDLGDTGTGRQQAELDDGFLLEIDYRRKQEPGFVSGLGIPYGFKSKTDEKQRERVQSWFQVLESQLADVDNEERLENIMRMVDLESLADYYLIQELVNNPDAFHSSTFVYRRQGEKMHYGPLWDFDLALANSKHHRSRYPQGWRVWNQEWNSYFRQLMQEPEFYGLVHARWKLLYSQLPVIKSHVRQAAAALQQAQEANFERWPILDQYVWPNPVVMGSYMAEVEFMLDWLQLRADWMDANFPAP